MQTRLKIALFLIDDDASMRGMLDTVLTANGIINYAIYSDPNELLKDLHSGVQICVIDYNLKHADYDGLGLMRAVLAANSYCKCIIMTAYEDAATIKAFLNAGAYKYLTKAEKNFTENLINYIKEGIILISEAFEFYATIIAGMKCATDELKKVTANG